MMFPCWILFVFGDLIPTLFPPILQRKKETFDCRYLKGDDWFVPLMHSNMPGLSFFVECLRCHQRATMFSLLSSADVVMSTYASLRDYACGNSNVPF